MNIYIDPLNIFRLICFLQGLTTGLVLIIGFSSNRTKMWLGILLALISFSVLDQFFAGSGIYYRHNSLYFMPLFFSWAFGPILYGYVCSLFKKNVKMHILHFVPVILQVLFYSCIVFQSLAYKTWFWQHVHKPYTRYVEYYGMCFSVLSYIALIFKKYQSELITARWLRMLLICLSIFFIVAIIDPVINFLYQPALMPKFYLITVVLPVIVFWLVLISLLNERFGVKNRPAAAKPADGTIFEKIEQRLLHEQLYKDADLSINALASAINVPANSISRIINETTGKSFTDYVNELRVAEVLRRLRNNEAEKFTLLSIAYDSGFNSKTTFNRVFKQKIGISPTAYLNGPKIVLTQGAKMLFWNDGDGVTNSFARKT